MGTKWDYSCPIKSKPSSISFWIAVIVAVSVWIWLDFVIAFLKRRRNRKNNSGPQIKILSKKTLKALKTKETKKFYFCRVFVKKYLFFHFIEKFSIKRTLKINSLILFEFMITNRIWDCVGWWVRNVCSFLSGRVVRSTAIVWGESASDESNADNR